MFTGVNNPYRKQMSKVMIIGSGDHSIAVMMAKRQFGNDVVIINESEREEYQFDSSIITLQAPKIPKIHIPIQPTGRERRRARRAKQRKQNQ